MRMQILAASAFPAHSFLFFLVPFYGLFARLFLPFTRFYPLLFHELLKFYFNRKTLDATFLKRLSIKCFADNLFHVKH